MTGELIAALGIGTTLLLGLCGWLAYMWIKELARKAVKEETDAIIHEERRKGEERYKNRPDNLDDALDRLQQ